MGVVGAGLAGYGPQGGRARMTAVARAVCKRRLAADRTQAKRRAGAGLGGRGQRRHVLRVRVRGGNGHGALRGGGAVVNNSRGGRGVLVGLKAVYLGLLGADHIEEAVDLALLLSLELLVQLT